MSDSPPAGHRHRAVLEGQVTHVRRHRDQRRRAGSRAGPPVEVDAVVVEAQRRDGRGVPPVEIERLPARVYGGRLEVAAVADEVAVDLVDAARAQSFDQLAKARERVGLACAFTHRVGREAALAEGGIAPAVEHQVALHHTVGHRPVRVEARLHGPVRRQQRRGHRRHHDLGVACGDEQLTLVPSVPHGPLLVHDRHAPEAPVHRWRVEAAVEPVSEGLGGERGEDGEELQESDGHARLQDGEAPPWGRRSAVGDSHTGPPLAAHRHRGPFSHRTPGGPPAHRARPSAGSPARTPDSGRECSPVPRGGHACRWL